MIHAPAVAVLVDGRRVHAYEPARLADGRVLAPVEPFLTAIGARITQEGGALDIFRGDRFAEVVTLRVVPPQSWTRLFVPVGPICRALGLSVRYDAPSHRLFIRTPDPILVYPTPFNPAVPRVAPRVVFTPAPKVTPRPRFTGVPYPRRTPLPFSAPGYASTRLR